MLTDEERRRIEFELKAYEIESKWMNESLKKAFPKLAENHIVLVSTPNDDKGFFTKYFKGQELKPSWKDES